MITALQARELTLASSEAIKSWLVHLELKIKESASQNKNTYVCQEHELCAYASSYFSSEAPNPLQLAIIDELRKYHYTVSWKSSTFKAGGGLGDLDDTPMEERPDNKKYNIVISW